MTLACGVANSKLVQVVTIADVDDVLQIWKVRFGHKAYFLFRL